MAEITAALVKELREKTGAGMMDCKRALEESKGDLEGAFDGLRKKGLAAAAKKAGRVAAEGLIGVATAGKAGVVVEVNSETDFVARNELFQNFVREVAKLAVAADRDVEALKAASFAGNGKTVEGELTDLIGRIGENMVLRRVCRLPSRRGMSRPMSTTRFPRDSVRSVCWWRSNRGRAMRCAGATGAAAGDACRRREPAISRYRLGAGAALERERAVLRDQAATTGKSEDIVERWSKGRLRKFYEESVLLDQVFVIDGESRVGKVVDAAAKAAGTPIKIAAFVRFALGEGIDRPPSDFAGEVGAQLNS
jgi:elongation factor Ts